MNLDIKKNVKNRFYKIWSGIKYKLNPTNPNYEKLPIDNRWLKFQNFYEDVIDLYDKHIENNPLKKSDDKESLFNLLLIDHSKGYFIDNIVFKNITMYKEPRHFVFYENQNMNLHQLAQKYGYNYEALYYYYIRQGMTLEKAIQKISSKKKKGMLEHMNNNAIKINNVSVSTTNKSRLSTLTLSPKFKTDNLTQSSPVTNTTKNHIESMTNSQETSHEKEICEVCMSVFFYDPKLLVLVKNEKSLEDIFKTLKDMDLDTIKNIQTGDVDSFKNLFNTKSELILCPVCGQETKIYQTQEELDQLQIG